MTELQTGLSIVLILFGVLLMFTGSLGLVRLPDFFCRTHASSKVDTLGIMVLLAGLAVHEGLTLTTAKLAIAISFIGLTNPVAAHALARAALHIGVKPWLPRRPAPSKEQME
jgi:multicomponent Na+:H+ antiporter subunit G